MLERANGNGRTKMTADDWAAAINTEWHKGVPSIINTGKLLTKAKEALGHGNWIRMVGDDDHKLVPGKLDFGARIAQMLMRIFEHKALSNAKNFSHLPPVYTTLHELSAIPPERLQQLIDDGTVHPRLKGSEAKTLRAGHIFVEELPKTLSTLSDFLDQCGSKVDPDTLDKLNYSFTRHLGLSGSPSKLKDWLLPRLGALLDQMQQYRNEHNIDPDKIVLNGKVCFREPREIAAPEPEEVEHA